MWCMNANRIQIQKILKTEKLINLALIRSKFIKDQLHETNKNIKTCKYNKNFFSYTLIDFALTEGILENVVLFNMNISTVKDSNNTSVLT